MLFSSTTVEHLSDVFSFYVLQHSFWNIILITKSLLGVEIGMGKRDAVY